MADITANASPDKKKSTLVATIASVAILSVVGVAGGWFVGKILAPQAPATEAAAPAAGAHGAAGEAGSIPKAADSQPNLLQIAPIVTNLAYPSDNWVRLELALQFNGAPDAGLAEEIHQNILAYLRTVSLQQIQGPRGFQYLRDDLREIVDLRSKGRITKVLFRTFVIE